LTATGRGFVNGNAILVPYRVVEYTDTTYTTEVQKEIGWGTLTLGASLTASTLARTTRLWAGTALNSSPAYSVSAPSAINIGTAANTLVFLGPDATNLFTASSYPELTLADQAGGMPVLSVSGVGNSNTLTNLQDIYIRFAWFVPRLVTQATFRVGTAYAGTTGTPISSAYARIYAIGTNGRPSKLLYDFGALGGANPLNATGNITSAAGNGYFLTPGEYFMDFIGGFSGATGTVTVPRMIVPTTGNLVLFGGEGQNTMSPYNSYSASSGTAGTAPDPANVASYGGNTSNNTTFLFALK